MMYGRGYIYPGEMMGGWAGPFMMMVFAVLLLVGIALLVMWVMRMSGGTGGAGGSDRPVPPVRPTHDEAIAIARRRFAAGEITKEQFEELMRALG